MPKTLSVSNTHTLTLTLTLRSQQYPIHDSNVQAVVLSIRPDPIADDQRFPPTTSIRNDALSVTITFRICCFYDFHFF